MEPKNVDYTEKFTQEVHQDFHVHLCRKLKVFSFCRHFYYDSFDMTTVTAICKVIGI